MFPIFRFFLRVVNNSVSTFDNYPPMTMSNIWVIPAFGVVMLLFFAAFPEVLSPPNPPTTPNPDPTSEDPQ